MIRKFVCLLEKQGDELWRHYCKVRNARNKKDFFDGLKGIANILDKILNN
jgi:hypothetical protein